MNKEFLQEIKKIYDEGYKIIEKKNHDYAGDNDPFKNFKNSEMVGVPLERGILVRIMDKISRISNLIDGEASVKDEAVEDTLIDLINYTAILLTYRKMQGVKKPAPSIKTLPLAPGGTARTATF